MARKDRSNAFSNLIRIRGNRYYSSVVATEKIEKREVQGRATARITVWRMQ